MHSLPLPDEQTIPNNQEDYATQRISGEGSEGLKKRQRTRVRIAGWRLVFCMMLIGVIGALCGFLLYNGSISGRRNVGVVKGRMLSVNMPTKAGSMGATPPVEPTATRGPMQIAVGVTATSDGGATPTMIATQVPTPTPAPSPTALPTPTDTPVPVVGVNGNPWGYDFVPGNRIYTTPTDFCRYFACISNFDNGTGYVIECSDGQYSRLGGKHGTCSHHGRVVQPLYAH